MFALLNKRWCSQVDCAHCVKPNTTEEEEGEWIADSDPSITVSTVAGQPRRRALVHLDGLQQMSDAGLQLTVRMCTHLSVVHVLPPSFLQHLFDSVQHKGQN